MRLHFGSAFVRYRIGNLLVCDEASQRGTVISCRREDPMQARGTRVKDFKMLRIRNSYIS